MENNFTKLIDDLLSKHLAGLGFQRVHEETSPSFDNALAILESADVRLRVIRERGICSLEFASIADPTLWFDSSVVASQLNVGESPAITDDDCSSAMAHIGEFFKINRLGIQQLFAPPGYASVKGSLIANQERLAKDTFGPI